MYAYELDYRTSWEWRRWLAAWSHTTWKAVSQAVGTDLEIMAQVNKIQAAMQGDRPGVIAEVGLANGRVNRAFIQFDDHGKCEAERFDGPFANMLLPQPLAVRLHRWGGRRPKT